MNKYSYKKKLRRNIPLSYISTLLGNLIFFIPIWVAYERQFLSFTQMSMIAAGRFGLVAILELPTGAIAETNFPPRIKKLADKEND